MHANDTIARNRYLEMLRTAFGVEMIDWLNRDDVIEVMLNPDGCLWVETLTGGKENTGVVIAEENSENIIKLVAAYKNEVADGRH